MKNNDDMINMVKEKYNLDDSETVSTVYLHLNTNYLCANSCKNRMLYNFPLENSKASMDCLKMKKPKLQ